MTLPGNILALDSEYFRLLFDKDNSSDREAMRAIFDLEHELTPVLARMEAGGVFLDRSLLDTESVNLRRRIEDLKKTIFLSA
jgi:DNA polymerase I-like protein with 3'-5' exonuclease and polymerase domains